MKTDYFIILCLYFFGLIIRAGYEQRKKADRINPKKRIVFIIVFLAMFLMWASWFSMCPLDPWQLDLPNVIMWVGFGAFLVGLVLAIGAVIQLRGVENIDHLVTTGLFSKIRHPMYVGFILWIFGWAIYHGAVISLFAGLVGVANILYWRRLEERDLKTHYGEVYLEYRKKTWF